MRFQQFREMIWSHSDAYAGAARDAHRGVRTIATLVLNSIEELLLVKSTIVINGDLAVLLKNEKSAMWDYHRPCIPRAR